MALVEFNIGKSKYQINCPDEEKEKLLACAKKIDERFTQTNKNFGGSIDEKTALVISMLMMQDEVDSTDNSPKKSADQESTEESLAISLESMADQIEKLAKKIENY